MACPMINSAVITPVLAAGSTTAPFTYQVNVAQRLCNASCAALTPVFNPVFSLKSYSQVGTSAYVATVHIEGLISYIPCNSNPCCTKTQMVSQDFTIPFTATGTIETVSITQGTAVNAIAVSPCQSCSRNFVSECPVFLAVTTA